MTVQIRLRKGQQNEWPKRVTAGSVTVTVYEVKAKSNATGRGYVLAWRTPDGRKTQPFANPTEAVEEARTKALQLASGRIEGAEMSRGDRDELQAARKLAETHGRTVLDALNEWLRAYELSNGQLTEAAKAWSLKHADTTKFVRLLAPECVEQFIAAKNRAGTEGDRTYGSKLKPIKTYFVDRYLDDITAGEWTEYLEQWEDGVTRNDLRKRAVTMCLWAQSRRFLPRGIKTEIEHTERVPEDATDIGILTPSVYRAALHWIHKNHPVHLPALVVAGLCGVRSDEIHGKRGARDDAAKTDKPVPRQMWEDIDLVHEHLNVTIAKRNTPAWRLVPLCKAAIKWLRVCAQRAGPICEIGAMEKVRSLLIGAGFELPENCFRHSFITYRVAVTQSKPQVAVEAGNSVGEIDRRYRRPQTAKAGIDWFASGPNVN